MDWWTNCPLNSLAGYLRINSLRMSISKPTPKVCTLLDLFSYESCCHFMQPFLEKRTHSDSFLWWSFIVYLLFIYLYFLQDGVNPTTGWLWKSQKQPWWVILVEREGADTMMNFHDDIPDLWNSLKGCVKWFGVTRSKCGNPHWTSSNKGMSAFSHHFGKAFEKFDPRFSWPTQILWSYQTVPLVAWQKTLRFKWNFQWLSSLTWPGRSLYRYSEFVEAGRPLDPGSLKGASLKGNFFKNIKKIKIYIHIHIYVQ